MSPHLQQAVQAAKQRRIAIGSLGAIVWLIWLSLLGWRLNASVGAIVAGIVGLLLAVVLVWQWIRRIDARWIARRLDQRHPAMEDSAELLFRDVAAMNALQRLQHERLRARVESAADLDLRDRWPQRGLLINAGVAIAALAVTAIINPQGSSNLIGQVAESGSNKPAFSTLQQISLAIEPPAYTGLPAHVESTLEGKAARDSLLRWTLRISPRPASANLSFHDGSTLALIRSGDDWSGERRLASSVLYRLDLGNAPALADQRLHRIDAVPDLAPEIIVIEPERSLSLLTLDQKTWPLRFEARDDYGLGDAQLLITLAQGSGENITVREQSLAVVGSELAAADQRPGLHRSYSADLDLAALGFGRGDDVIVRLSVADNAQPQPNITRSASFILRWPPEATSEGVGMEGLVQNTLPAYFRSQRQIIIDSEKLVADKAVTSDEDFMIRSDTIGVDQKILRLRYGQFLGEESESGQSAAPKSSDEHDDDHEHIDGDDHAKDKQATQQDALANDHDHANEGDASQRFGDATNVLAEYGHTHDHAEAATLLDPETRRILKAALDEMWQAEMHLRLGAPELALPYEHRALGYIKQVQQASRIYLARVGLELPELDETRRLTGKRDDVSDRADALIAADAEHAIIATTWQTLDSGGDAATALQSLERWVRERETALPDALGLIASIDNLRRDPQCGDCRQRLQAQLWPLLPNAAARATPRVRDDAAAEAWLDALPQPAKNGTTP